MKLYYTFNWFCPLTCILELYGAVKEPSNIEPYCARSLTHLETNYEYKKTSTSAARSGACERR